MSELRACEVNQDANGECAEKYRARYGTQSADATTDCPTASYSVVDDEEVGMAIDVE
jgi:hypothetical protein